jgi:hypothetical protein
MDPDNTVMSHKMLLNNLDLKVITPSGDILHGNNIAGDEVNNVSDSYTDVGFLTVLLLSAVVGRTSFCFNS